MGKLIRDGDSHVVGAQPLVVEESPLVGTAAPGSNDLLLENASYLLLETGDKLILES